jgi:uncharacterized protein YjiS (DUF1127 family)
MALVNMLIAAGKAISEWRRRQRAYEELMTLDDHFLADIGIRRSQIRNLVEGDQPIVPPTTAFFLPKREPLASRRAL